MAEKVKKTKALFKPRTAATSAKSASTTSTQTAVAEKTVAPVNSAGAQKTVAQKTTGTRPPVAKAPSHEAIALLAYQFWAERGWKNGHHEQDWLRAERELSKKAI